MESIVTGIPDNKKIEIARKVDVERITGYRIGAISPIGIKKQLKMVMDKCRSSRCGLILKI